MKNVLAVVLLFALLVLTTIPVMAAADVSQREARTVFSLAGKVTAIDAATGMVTVHILRGNYPVRAYFNTDVALVTVASTRYLMKTSPLATPVLITFSDLKTGDPVSVNGTLSNNVWLVNRITVGASLVHFP